MQPAREGSPNGDLGACARTLRATLMAPATSNKDLNPPRARLPRGSHIMNQNCHQLKVAFCGRFVLLVVSPSLCQHLTYLCRLVMAAPTPQSLEEANGFLADQQQKLQTAAGIYPSRHCNLQP